MLSNRTYSITENGFIPTGEPRYMPALEDILRKLSRIGATFTARDGTKYTTRYKGSTLFRMHDQAGKTHLLSYDKVLELYSDSPYRI